MTNNFLITLRNDTGCGCPGIGFGTAGHIEIPETNTNYDVQDTMDPQEWLDHIADTSTSVLVFVHGFGNDSCKIIERHNTIKPHVPPGVTLVSFDWPSGNPGFSAYQNDKLNAASSASYFIRDCLKVLLRKFPPGNIHLFGHSMGAYVIEQAFQAPGQVFTLGHVLLAAGDVDQSNYGDGTPLLANYLSHCNNLSVYWSQDDQALIDSQRINKYTPLGLQGFKTVVPDRCQSIDCNWYYSNVKSDPPPPPPPPPPPNLPFPPISPAEFSHVWYLLYAPKPPPVNDFYSDVGAVLRGYLTFPTRAPKPPPPLPPDKNSFSLQRPKP